MKSKTLILSVITVGLLFASRPVAAHHGFAGRYDEANPVTVTGTVVQFDFVNPHSVIVFDATDKGKTERWQAELGSAGQLHKADGWSKDTLKPGDKITIMGPRAKNGAPDMNLSHESRITLVDSAKVIHDSIGTSARPPAANRPAGQEPAPAY